MKPSIPSQNSSILPIFELRQILTEYAQPEKKEGMQAYIKNLYPFLGVTATARKAAFKQFVTYWHPQNKQELKQWIVELWNEPEREFQYMALEFMSKYIKWFDHSDIPFIKELIIQKSWWDTVDMLAGSYLGNILIKHQHALPQVIEEFTGDTNMWVNRSAIICQLKFRDQTNTDLLEYSILPHMNSKEFFHQKAIGWALRQYAKSNPHWVVDFVNKYPLKPLSKREALKHLK